jgi:hypothetical protein
MATKSVRKLLGFDKNTIEAVRDSGISVAKTASKTLIQEAQADTARAWKQLLGVTENADKRVKNADGQMHDLKEGEEVSFSKKEKKTNAEPAINYFAEIIHSEKRISGQENRQLNEKIEMLRIEISKLARSSKELEVMVKDVSIERVGPNPGKYHLNFFEWVLATIQIARIRVEESANWLSTVSSKSRRRDYWNMSKKHGTSYMLSGERVVAQQTG